MSLFRTTAELLARWKKGDHRVEEELFIRYTIQLIAQTRVRLSSRLSGRIDVDDLAQSAYRSFFTDADQHVSQRSGDLWRLLTIIMLRSLYRPAGRPASKTDLGTLGLPMDVLGHDPSPVEMKAIVDLVMRIMRGMDPTHRRMFELKLQGYNLKEIAEQAEQSERLTRQVLAQVKEDLNRLCEPEAGG